ncbi:MAG: methyltransferase domain-containing protein, partial [Bacteroidota bacterium]|nr:methyltransferase domain-containing protein [Bacteroidota bacterium]
MKKTVCIDHLVTGETFVLEPYQPYEILKTTPQPKNLDRYYNHPNYISHKVKGRSLFFAFYALLRQSNHKYKIKLIHKHMSTKGKLLDFGAGTGSFVRFAQKKGWDAEGYEPITNAHSSKASYVKEWIKAS